MSGLDEKQSVLIVDDVPENVFIMEKTLQGSDYDVISANSGESAIDLLSKRSVDLILLDIQMPDMDGFEATDIIRNRENNGDLDVRQYIIAMTADVTLESQKKCKEVGMDSYMSKPISLDDLKELVEVEDDEQ